MSHKTTFENWFMPISQRQFMQLGYEFCDLMMHQIGASCAIQIAMMDGIKFCTDKAAASAAQMARLAFDNNSRVFARFSTHPIDPDYYPARDRPRVQWISADPLKHVSAERFDRAGHIVLEASSMDDYDVRARIELGRQQRPRAVFVNDSVSGTALVAPYLARHHRDMRVRRSDLSGTAAWAYTALIPETLSY